MIPHDDITAWRAEAPWVQDYQVEQDLVISRALYQRRKGRDLFDLAVALKNPNVDPARIITAFAGYMEQEGGHITRAMFEKNLAAKLAMKEFTADITPLLSSSYRWNLAEASQEIQERLINLLPGNPWKGE